MYTIRYGGKKGEKVKLKIAEDRVVVRTKNARALDSAIRSSKGRKMLQKFEIELNFPDADVCVLQAKKLRRRGASGSVPKAIRDEARNIFKKEPELRFAGRVLVDETSENPVLYTENIFIKFKNSFSASECESFFNTYSLGLKRKAAYAENAYFVCAPDGTGLEIFPLCEKLLNASGVELCHPELVRHSPRKTIHEKQWHLASTTIDGREINAHANVAAAQKITKGEGIVVAVIDDGVDIDHPEFNIPGKVVGSRDVTLNRNDPRPKFFDENHGTACAGVAVASGINASGVAPEAKLMPIRLASVLGSMAEAEAFFWAANKGADVISCSWGPTDGAWYRPNDPGHDQYTPIPDSTRLAIEYAAREGREGKGCVICWAAGNGRELVTNDGYASFEKVIAVGACNDTGKHSVYSDFGAAIWCCFPSGDFAFQDFNQPAPLTSGIFTTDRRAGMGYRMNDYTDNFTGTSSATPGVAGVAALILSVNPELTCEEVRNLLATSCEKIDLPGGEYDAKGHSPYYGYGRIDAAKAVRLAQEISDSVTEEGGNHVQPPSEEEVILIPNKPQIDDVRIVRALVNPPGRDRGRETLTFKNEGNSLSLDGWTVEDALGRVDKLAGELAAGESIVFQMQKVKLTNLKGKIILKNDKGKTVVEEEYTKNDIDKKSGVVRFS